MTNISGWQRLGIAITLVWVIGAAVATVWLQHAETEDYLSSVLSFCVRYRGADEYAECARIAQDARIEFASHPFNWPPVLLIALGPVPVFWLAGWLTLGIGRWIGRGFTAANSN